MDWKTTLILLLLAVACWLGSKYFEKRQKALVDRYCLKVDATVADYVPLEGADRKGRPVFATVLHYEVDGKSYEVQLDDRIAAQDQLLIGSKVKLLCSKEDPSECMPEQQPKKRNLFGL